MRLALPLARRWLGLPPPRCRARASLHWLALSDGTRLATLVARPETSAPAPTVLTRVARAVDADPLRLLAHALAERGYVVVAQSCRGRAPSEGRFTPFADEVRDGAQAIGWIAAQPWFDGRLALVGSGYAGHAAWAACAGAGVPVAALAVAFAARDPYAWLYQGGALRLELALELGVGIGERAPEPPRRLDLARATRFRPLREADRVALRQSDWYREWVDHACRDAFWAERCPPLPSRPPPTLLVAGWQDPALGAQLLDHAELAARAAECGEAAPQLRIGPWGAAQPPRPERARRGGSAAVLREVLDFLDQVLGGARGAGPAVRLELGGGGRAEASGWPPPDGAACRLHLRSGGRANGADGDGRLEVAPPEGVEPPDRFVYDPADAVPSGGDAARAAPADAANPCGVEQRGDVLCYTSGPLAADLELVGPARAVLFAASDAPDTDFTAKLVELREDGAALWICDGILRCRQRAADARAWLEPGRVERLVIELPAVGHRLRAGRRLRVEISSSCFPRYDRNPNTRAEPARAREIDLAPARQTLHHDRERPSHVALTLRAGAAAPAFTRAGPAGAKADGPGGSNACAGLG